MLKIQGQGITEHPLKDDPFLSKYRKIADILAVDSLDNGVIITPEGEMAFKVGDYIVTDNPPTHAWPVKREVFERTYARIATDDD